MSRPVVGVTLQEFCRGSAEPRALLERAGFEVRENTLGRRPQRVEVLALLDGAVAVLAGVERYDDELMAALPALRCISRCGVGTDAIDLAAAQRRGISVYTTPDEVTQPVAELTVALAFALARNLPLHAQEVRAGEWRKRTGWLLSEWTVGLVGFGRIGRAVERLLRPFGPRVLVADPILGSGQVPAGVEICGLSALLARADLVSLHAGRPVSAGPLLGARELAQMKPGSRLINTARGYLVDEAALEQALRSGHLAGAALDVFETEPYTGPLSQLPQVLCTPHVASLTHASRAAMERRCAEHVGEHFRARHGTLVQAVTVGGR